MKKERAARVVTILTVITAIIAIISAVLEFSLPMFLSFALHFDAREASSIGIIGGADGPTAIYLAGQTPAHLITAIFASLTIAGIVYRSFLVKGGE